MTAAAIDAARTKFRALYGEEPVGTAFAPGRVNLIGDHVDYNGGLVLPMPLQLGTAVAWRRSDKGLHFHAADMGGKEDRFDPANVPPATNDWRSYVRGMSALFARKVAALPGADLVIAGDLPRGAGLSSSASLCVALGRAFADIAQVPSLATRELALLAQQVEHDYAGVACGIMDQMVCAGGKSGKLMLLDCRDLSFTHLAFPHHWSAIIVQSGVTRGLVDGEYNKRRAQCEEAAKSMGVDTLRDANSAAMAKSNLPPIEAARARHVIEEIDRVGHVLTALKNEDLCQLGHSLRASHASLRDLFEVSHKEVDMLAGWLNEAIGDEGGARMTGGGFGGAVIAVCHVSEAQQVISQVSEQFESRTGKCPEVLICNAGSY